MIYLEDETTTKISCCALNFFSESSWPLLILMLHVKIKVTDHSENISIIRILATQGPSHPSLVPWIQSRKFKWESYDRWRAPSDGKSKVSIPWKWGQNLATNALLSCTLHNQCKDHRCILDGEKRFNFMVLEKLTQS